ncbi:hypothetical protein SDC9_85815 [bioreactor metagenome]|uniref:Uncharacterized protein n=1 Tax=bioreactor metagenome TaxID=1076179 RepID=A0A644ZE75_9ZZZZ
MVGIPQAVVGTDQQLAAPDRHLIPLGQNTEGLVTILEGLPVRPVHVDLKGGRGGLGILHADREPYAPDADIVVKRGICAVCSHGGVYRQFDIVCHQELATAVESLHRGVAIGPV